MKMTKATIKNLLKSDYMTALSGFASYLADKKDMETALEILDEKVWDIAEEIGCAEEWLSLYSALLCAV